MCNQTPIRLLFLEKNPVDCQVILEMLRESNYKFQVLISENLSSCMRSIIDNKPDVILIDSDQKKHDILPILSELHRFARQVPIVVLTDTDDDQKGIEALQAGAQDYLVKGYFDTPYLAKTLRFTIERQRILHELKQANAQILDMNQTLEERVAKRTAELKEAKEKAEKNLAIRNQFLDNITHEVRTPLTAISGSLQLLKKKSLPNDIRPFLDLMDDASGRVQHFFEHVLDLSVIKTGGLKLNKTQFQVQEIARPLIEYTRSTIKNKDVRLRFNIPGSNHQTLSGDPTQIIKMMKCLLDNAVKFTQKGGIEFSVLSTPFDGKRIQLSLIVSNTGNPISKEQQQLIFQDFVQGTNKKTSDFRGAGLGLSISSQIAKLMGGHLSYRRDVNKGNIFEVKLTLDTDYSFLRTYARRDSKT